MCIGACVYGFYNMRLVAPPYEMEISDVNGVKLSSRLMAILHRAKGRNMS